MSWANSFRHPIQGIKLGTHNWQTQHRSHPKAQDLLRQSLSMYRDNLWRVASIILIITIPVTLISTYSPSQSGDTALTAYITLAELAMNAALIWALIQLFSGQRVSAKEAYYKGSVAIVRMLLVALLFVLMLLPLVFGLLVLNSGVIGADSQAALGEKVLLVAVAILLSLPALAMLLRGFFALYIIFEGHLGPWQAIRQSMRLTKGKVVLSARRLFILLVAMAIVLIVPVVLLAALAISTKQVLFLVLLQILIALVVLPISNLYLYGYYQSLKE